MRILLQNLSTQSMQTSTSGSIRVISKRKGGVAAAPGEVIIDVDRVHPVLGNKYVLSNHNDHNERERVIARYTQDFEQDTAVSGPMFGAIVGIAERVSAGERIALRCWCAPRKCHADILRAKVLEILGIQDESEAMAQVDMF